MKKRVQRKVEHLRAEPEHVRQRAAMRYTLIAGALVVLLWVTVLLPIQLNIGEESEQEGDASEGVVAGIRDALFTKPGAQPTAGASPSTNESTRQPEGAHQQGTYPKPRTSPLFKHEVVGAGSSEPTPNPTPAASTTPTPTVSSTPSPTPTDGLPLSQ